MSDKSSEKSYVALLGWSLKAIEALDKFDRRYVVVAPQWAEDYARENDIPYIPWNFERLNDRSMEIADTLKDDGVDVAIPLFEETVEWARKLAKRIGEELNYPVYCYENAAFEEKRKNSVSFNDPFPN